MAMMVSEFLILLCSALLPFGNGEQPRRVGMQAFRLMDNLWIDGGRFLDENGTIVKETASTLLSYDLAHSFDIPNGPSLIINQLRGAEAHVVYHGFMFSNLVDKAWLFGGHPVDDVELPIPNDIWRFEPGAGEDGNIEWTRLPSGDNITAERPYRGAGCDVPDLQRGFYLGGIASDIPSATPRYLHWLYEFDTENEVMRSFPVPDFVPVVNHSLVYLDTRSRGGALLALGGMIEVNGSLSKAPLSSVFIFDIESRIWINQPVTGWDGNLEEDSTFDVAPPNGGIPRSRMSGCAVVGSAQDKTSHNIIYLGGMNETRSSPDAWVLSLPSGIWIKARFNDPFSSPKIENSCVLVNERFVWMFGGCFFDPSPGKPCKAYSYNPLVYGLGPLKIADYRHNEVGFLVEKTISNIIGGSETGNSTQREPMFTNFSSPILHALFNPPVSQFFNTSEIEYQSDPRIIPDVVTYLVTPVVVGVLLYLVAQLWPYLRRKVKVSRQPSQVTWRPSVFSQWYLLFLTTVTGVLIGLVVVLANTSQAPDPNYEHWSGGLDSDGVWTGSRLTSTFIRSATTGQPPQGLISFYLDKEGMGIWSERNSTQRIGFTNYWVLTYLPTLVAVIYGRLWKVLDDEVKRVDKYARLRKPGGKTAKDTIFLEYHSFWVPLSFFQALWRGHWCVAISSLGLTLGAVIAPIIQNYMFVWTLYSGAHLPWPNTYSWQVALVDPWWYKVWVGILSSCLVCSLFLLCFLPWQGTGIRKNPEGLASIVWTIPEANRIFQPSSAAQKLSELESNIGDLRLHLTDTCILELVHTPPAPTPAANYSTFLNKYPKLRPTVQRTEDIVKCIIGTLQPIGAVFQAINRKLRLYRIYGYFIDYPLTLPFQPAAFAIWILILTALLAFTAIIAHGLITNARDQLWNYTVPLAPDAYLTVAVLIQSVTDVMDYSIRALAPFYELSKGYQPASILFVDYTPSSPLSVLPVWNIVQGLKSGHYLLAFSVMASLATTILTVFLGSLQLSTAYYGATSFLSDQAAATAATCLVAFVLMVHAVIGWKIRRVGRRMKRAVETIGGVAPYVVFSKGLREDLDKVRGKSRKETLTLLKGRRYAFGVYRDGNVERFGVERQFEDGGMVDVDRVL
ncbi:hypothetical protein QBC35DRAFT_500646 [Podospora australis]|uniref:Uncharacterized protein n=1 Tax=Podospora australis TaxID=1536484 RepID=A0AAN7AI96_9PEZI|nr:hypothetical protein QBC35DRAFT_500646 [Podospora australis]